MKVTLLWVRGRWRMSVETVKAKLPALVTVTREINQPRIPSLDDDYEGFEEGDSHVDVGGFGC